MKQIFISYSRKDKDFAHRLITSFTDREIESWIDWEDIPPSVNWRLQIQKGIEETNVFVFIVSPDSLQSNICEQELEHAVRNGKRIIPIVVRNIETQQAFNTIAHLNWIFFREQDHFESSFEKLIAAIQTDYDWVQVHRRLQMRALEWERGGYENSFLLRGKDLQDAEAQLLVNAKKNPIPTELQNHYVSTSRVAEDSQLASERLQQQQLFLEKNTGTRLRRLTFILLGIFTIAFIALFFWTNKIAADLVIRDMSEQLRSVVQTGVLVIDPQEFAELLKIPASSESEIQDPLYVSHQAILKILQQKNPNISPYTISRSENPDEIYVIGSHGARNHPELSYTFKAVFKKDHILYKTLDTGLRTTIVDTEPHSDELNVSWMTGCTPIRDDAGHYLGALCADLDSSYVRRVQSNITKALIVAFLSIYPLVIILILSATQVLQGITSRIGKLGKRK